MSAFAPPGSRSTGSQAPPTTSISSSFASPTSSTPTVPSKAYEDLCKVVLKRRNRNLLALSALASAGALYVGVFDPRELPGSFFNILPLLVFSPFAFLGSLPIIVLRKQTITTARPPLPTRFARFNELRTRPSLQVFLAYLLSAAFLHTAYVWAAGWASRDAKLGLFFFHEGRDAWQVNERRILLGVLHAFVAVAATVQHVVQDRSQVHFDEDSSLTIPARLSAKASRRVAAAVSSSTSTVVTFWTAYVLLRRPILRFVLVHLAGGWARPHLWSAMRYNGAYSLTLGARAFSSALFIALVWEAAHVCFEVYATQPITVSQFSPSPNQALLSGLRSSDPYYQQFAYLELASLTLTDSGRRQAIFKDVKPGSSTAGAWNEISRECLVMIGTELQRAKGRGSLPRRPPPHGVSHSSISQQQSQSSPNRARVMSGAVFQPTKPTFFDKLASSATTSTSSPSPVTQAVSTATHGATAQQAQQAVSSALTTASNAVSRVPSILQSASLSAGVPSSVVEQLKPAEGAVNIEAEEVLEVIGFEQKFAKYVPAPLRTRLFAIGMESRARRSVPKRREVVCAVQALSNLICASLTEDPYGVAQRDIPKILEAFVRYLSVLNGLAVNLEKMADRTLGPPEEKEKARKVVEREVGEVQKALRSGAKAILTEFAEYIGEFRFPTSISAQLQALVDYGA